MEELPPTIVSSNRFNDLEPYCSRIYHQDPDAWNSVFPWEFPQHASKEREEEFLSNCFSKDEIHMQGYKFLKQVFYSIALYNLHVRIPAFTDWWLAKPSSEELLNDPNMHPFLLKSDVTTSTFFETELAQYGEKFLRWTIPHLQSTIRQRLEKQQNKNNAVPAPIDTAKHSRLALREVSGESEPKSALSATSIVKTTVSLPSPANFVPMSAKVAPQSAPPQMTAAELAPRPRVINKEQQPTQTQPSHHRPMQDESQAQRRKRGNSFSRPNSYRSRGNYSNRNERNAPIHPGPIYVLTPQNMRGNQRAASDGPTNFMNSISQGQAMPPTPMQHQFYPAQLGHPMYSHHNMPQDPNFASNYPPPYFNHPFAEPQNPQGFPQFDPQMQYFDQPGNFQGNHRRNSQGSRGRPFRGYHGGKNSRGKNSFSSYDQFQQAFQQDGGSSKHFGDGIGHPNTHRKRRGSAIFEKNWRSGSEDPQIRQAGLSKENRPPEQQWMSRDSFAEPPPHSYAKNYYPNLTGIDPAKLDQEQKCNRDWIGERCTYADKLIAIDVLASRTDDGALAFFSKLADVKHLGRAAALYEHPDGRPRCNLFITFKSPTEARKCLFNKPAQWPDGEALKLEVSKNFWDETHSHYVFKSRHEPAFPMSPPEEPRSAEGQVSAILRRTRDTTPVPEASVEATIAAPLAEDTSADATPTPSGASTPKKKKNNKSKSKSKKKDKEDLRKASLKNDMDLSIDTGEANNEMRTSLAPPVKPIEKQRSDSEQTEVRSKSEPSLVSPNDTIQTNLPVPSSARTEVQTSSEIGFSPADEIAMQLPDDTAPFRTEEEKETTAAWTPARISDISETTTTPHKSDDDPVDDSFHTATGSTADLAEKDKITTPMQTTTIDISEVPLRKQSDAGDSPVSPKTAKRVHVPQLNTRTRLASTSSTSTAKPEGLEPPQPPVSAISPAFPTPAFFTAPNTPAAPHVPCKEHESDVETSPNAVKEDVKSGAVQAKELQEEAVPQPANPSEVEEVSPTTQAPNKHKKEEAKPASEPTKRPEKAKGPAQTESFSLFGKKKENQKKPKGGKKGTLKGKPRMDSAAASEVASDFMSRVVSGASTPAIEPALQTPIEVTKKVNTKDDMKDEKKMQAGDKWDHALQTSSTKTENEIPTSSKNNKRKHRSESKVTQQAATTQDTERAMAEDLVAPPVIQQETPSKRKGLGSLLSGLFTGSKTQDKPVDDSTNKSESIFGQAKFSALKSLTGSGDLAADGTSQATSNNDADGAEAAKKKSNKNKIGRKKKKKPVADGDKEESQATQPADEPKSSPVMFRFGNKNESPFRLSIDSTTKKEDADEDAISPTTLEPPAPAPSLAADKQEDETEVGPGVDAASDATSHTDAQHDEAPSSDTIQSPTPSGGKKVPPMRTDTSNHLVEAKIPKWKTQRKRVITPRKADTPPESEAGDVESTEDPNAVTLFVRSPEEKKKTFQLLTADDYVALQGGENRPQKYYLYVGRGTREDDVSGGAVGEDGADGLENDVMRKIAEQEARRVRGRMEGMNEVEKETRFEDVTDE